MTAGMGLDSLTYEHYERKRQRVRDVLLELAMPKRLVRRFEKATSRAHRAGDPLPDGIDFDAFASLVFDTGIDLSALMEEARSRLHKADAKLYDVGVMLARFDLCLRVLRLTESELSANDTSDSEEFFSRNLDIYARELARVVPILSEMVDEALEQLGRSETHDPELRDSLVPLAGDLRRWDNGSAGWRHRVTSHARDVFTTLGVMTLVGAPEVGGSERSRNSGHQILAKAQKSRSQLYEQALNGDLDAAEEGQRRLIEETRQRFGPGHPITLNVRNDLALTLALKGKADLAVDRTYDVADDAERVHGARSPATAYEQVRTLQILMATRNIDEVLDFFQSRLKWLTDSNPADLDSDLLESRSALLDLLGS